MIPVSGFPLPPRGEYPTDPNGFWSAVSLKLQEYYNYFLPMGFFIPYDNTVTDYFQIIQSAVNAWPKVIIGSMESEVFMISQPIIQPSNSHIVVNGTLKVQDGKESFITEDVPAGQSWFKVANPEYFTVGQQVGITDDLQFYNPDKSLLSSTGTITDITGNVITFSTQANAKRDLGGASFEWGHPFLVSENARCGHMQCVIRSEFAKNSSITGRGVIDGNRYGSFMTPAGIGCNQMHSQSGYPSKIEEQRAACAVSVFAPENFFIGDGLRIKDGLMHSLAIIGYSLSTSKCLNVTQKNLTVTGGRMKCIINRIGDGWNVENVDVSGATYEDGFIFYSGVTNAIVNGLRSYNNNRYGFSWNSTASSLLTANNIRTRGNVYAGVHIAAKNANISNIISNDPLFISRAYECWNVNLTNVTLLAINTANHDIKACVDMFGGVDDIKITNLTIDGCTGTGIQTRSLLGNTPQNVKISNWKIKNHTGTEISLAAGSDVTFSNPT